MDVTSKYCFLVNTKLQPSKYLQSSVQTSNFSSTKACANEMSFFQLQKHDTNNHVVASRKLDPVMLRPLAA